MKYYNQPHVPFKQIDIWNNFSKRLLSASKVELFLDYDGTITPIHKTPSEAILAPDTIHILQQLLQLPNVRVTIVTGRSMKDIQRFIPFEDIRLIANHGFQIYQDKTEWIHPDAQSSQLKMHELQDILNKSLESFPKAYVEGKQFTLSIHYRNAAAQDVPYIKELTLKAISSFDPKLVITEGKEVIEVRPPVKWGKGHAVRKILNANSYPPNSMKIYIGDDMTDEDAFQVLKTSGITIHVGETPDTKAQYYVDNVKEVLQILKMIIKLRTHHSNQFLTS
jgi:trehalose 6-phosphate phosphatase